MKPISEVTTADSAKVLRKYAKAYDIWCEYSLKYVENKERLVADINYKINQDLQNKDTQEVEKIEREKKLGNEDFYLVWDCNPYGWNCVTPIPTIKIHIWEQDYMSGQALLDAYLKIFRTVSSAEVLLECKEKF